MKEELQKEIKRCEGLLLEYEGIGEGFFGVNIIRQALDRAYKAKTLRDKEVALADLIELE